MKKEEIYYLKLTKRELSLKSKIYTYESTLGRDGYIRSASSMLIIREIGELKNTIIPISEQILTDKKRIKFVNWLKRIRTDDNVPSGYRLMATMFKN